ncbi:MAG: galactose/methyl galactoside ABC transporter permease MglC [Sphaerochaeta sp.]|nr:galactose/methyl galactoside ABC transporter permease MglC [Sphaerochaeta sp.]
MQYAIYLVLVAIIVTIVILEPSILSVRNATFILQQAAPKLIIALGLAGLILLGGTDLSAGRMVGIAGVICASLLQKPDYALRIFKTMAPLPIIVPLLIAIGVCVFFAMMHSMLISFFQIAPFIASLGMQMIVYGVMSLYFDGVNNSSPIGGFDTRFTKIAQGSIQMGSFRLPWIVIYALVITFFFWVLWYRTTLGRNMYAVGGNKEAAIVSGVNTKRVIILVYILAGVAYALAGFLDAGRTGSATNGLGEGYELDAIASCVVGGVSLRGGVGRISGVVTGVLIFQVLSYCLVYMDINPYIQFIIKGMIIIFATVVDTQKYIKKR